MAGREQPCPSSTLSLESDECRPSTNKQTQLSYNEPHKTRTYLRLLTAVNKDAEKSGLW